MSDSSGIMLILTEWLKLFSRFFTLLNLLEILLHQAFNPLKDFFDFADDSSLESIGVLSDLDNADEFLVVGKNDIIGGAVKDS